MDQPLTSTPKPKFSYSDSGSFSDSPCVSFGKSNGRMIELLFKKVRGGEDKLRANSAPSKSRRSGPPDPVPYRLTAGSEVKHQLVATQISQEEYDPYATDKSFVETKYEVAKYFPSSRYSEVQKVVSRGTPGTYFALKKICTKGDGAVTPSNRRRECYYSLKMKHKNLVQTFEVYKQDCFYYVLMEYCVIDLKGVMQLKDDEAFGKKHYWDFICDMLGALLYLSRMGLLHLDIKPPNIMLSPQGIWKLGDYGLVCKENEKVDVKESGDTIYSAPETNDKNYTAKCDLFSMGLVFIEVMLDADMPIPGVPTASDRYQYIRQSPDMSWFVDPLTENGYCSEAIYLTRRMINPDPANRPSVKMLCRRPAVHKKLIEREKEYDTPKPAEKLKDILDDLVKKDEEESKLLMERWQLEKKGDFSKSIREEDRQLPTVAEVSRQTAQMQMPNGAPPRHAHTDPRNAGRCGAYLETPLLKCERFALHPRPPRPDDLDASPQGLCQDSPPGREGSSRRLVFDPSNNGMRLSERRNLQKAFDETESLDSPVSPIPLLDPNESGAYGGNGSLWNPEATLSFLSPQNQPETQSESSHLESSEEQKDDPMESGPSDEKKTVTLDIRVVQTSFNYYNQRGQRMPRNGLPSRPVPHFPSNEQAEAPAENGVEDMETE